MVTVAKSLDAPIKLLAPKPTSSGYPAEFAMLGLGDVVVPGLMIALCLRFDLAQYAKKRLAEHKKEVGTSGTFSSVIASGERGKADGKKGKGKGRVEVHDISPRTPFPRVYFWTGVGSYLVGLGVTMGVMHTFKAAQPALLYLSPACCKSSFLIYSSPGLNGMTRRPTLVIRASFLTALCLRYTMAVQAGRIFTGVNTDTQSSDRSVWPLSAVTYPPYGHTPNRPPPLPTSLRQRPRKRIQRDPRSDMC